MYLYIFPLSKQGKQSLLGILILMISILIFFLFVHLGERGGETFFSNPKLYIPYLIASISGTYSLITGTIAFIKSKDYAILTITATLIGMLTTLWNISEILFPH